MDPFKYSDRNVVLGREGQLFLFNGGHHVHDYHTGKKRPTQESVSTAIRNIESRLSHCVKHNVEFLHVIFPNKQIALQELYPDEITSVIDLFFSPNTPVDSLLDMRTCLERIGPSAWLKTDTHLTRKAETVCSVEIANSLLKDDLSNHMEQMLQASFIRQSRGDLSIMMGDDGIDITEEEILYATPWIHHYFHNKIPGGNNGLINIFVNPNAVADSRLLFFGDSFGRGCASCLSFFFSHVMFCRTPFLHYEIADLYKPDYLVTQSIERYLPSSISDSSRPLFLLYPALGKHGNTLEGDKKFFEALNGELSYPSLPYLQFMEAISSIGPSI